MYFLLSKLENKLVEGDGDVATWTLHRWGHGGLYGGGYDYGLVLDEKICGKVRGERGVGKWR